MSVADVSSTVLCQCGCGHPTPIATRSQTSNGSIKGQPLKCLPGHHARGLTGQQANAWKGGSIVHSAGYVQILRHGHLRASQNGYVFEHILIAEHAIGYALPPSAEVHHVNTRRSDNRNQNLVICQDRGYHMLLHQRMRAYEATGSASSIRCKHCREWSSPEDRTMKQAMGGTSHYSCAAKYRRELRKRL